MVLYPYRWAICCMFQNHWVNSLFTEMTIWGPWCPRRVSQTGITHAWDKCFCHGSSCMCISVLTLVSLMLFLACGTVKVKRPCLFIHLYISIRIIFLLFYSCWQAITRMLPNQYANASVTITALVSEAGASNRDDILSMPEMRASGTGVLNVHWCINTCVL